ncbi:hypothetical protein H696_03891 [Fonticula alba]|uniref:Uncharacterized protein n=1 Tax=Fonticula alba TaxID=691883 RepID=A0A058Z7J8_FONAL|nr:hypothetical protein H696_03891 [Fonticula alba]KCV69462.1 hypothetical protein H696_03891 [Fonticula alba]|eukprot:XP_009496027.1 hypothetical protein H696_03891 [Fonticula alba]
MLRRFYELPNHKPTSLVVKASLGALVGGGIGFYVIEKHEYDRKEHKHAALRAELAAKRELADELELALERLRANPGSESCRTHAATLLTRLQQVEAASIPGPLEFLQRANIPIFPEDDASHPVAEIAQHLHLSQRERMDLLKERLAARKLGEQDTTEAGPATTDPGAEAQAPATLGDELVGNARA